MLSFVIDFSFNLIFLRFIHVVTCICGVCVYFFIFLCVWVIFHCWIYHILFIYLSVDVHLGCFQFVTILNNAAMNIFVYKFLYTHTFSFLLGRILGIELLGHMKILYLPFGESAKLFSKVVAHSHQQCMRILVFPYPHQYLFLVLFCFCFHCRL